MLYCKCFGLAVGEDVYDLRLPSASRIPDLHVTVWISWQFSIFGFLISLCIYLVFSLSYVQRPLSSLLSVTLLHPRSPPCVPLYSLLYFLCTQFRSPGTCRVCLSATTSSGEPALAHNQQVLSKQIKPDVHSLLKS